MGVPEITPVTPFNVMPAGSAPAVTANVGVGLPSAVIVVVAEVPTVKAGIAPLIAIGATAAGATTPEKIWLADPALFVAVTVKV